MRPRYWFAINAGGKATRMGPWAPRLKPFLPIGPMNAEDGEPAGPCVVERILRNYKTWLDQADLSLRTQVQFVLATGSNPQALVDWLETVGLTELAEGVLLVPDAIDTGGPMALVHQVPEGVSLLLHNGDDLIARRGLHNFLNFCMTPKTANHGEVIPNTQPSALLTTLVQQRGAFGEIVTTPYGFKVAEKPVHKEAPVGCGVLFLNSADIDYAKKISSSNSSTVLTALELAYASGKRAGLPHPVTFGIPSHYWATVGNPEEYLKACHASAWLEDENFREWQAASGVKP